MHQIKMPARFHKEQALLRLADYDDLVLLSSPTGGSYLLWDQEPIVCNNLEELQAAQLQASKGKRQQTQDQATWPTELSGGSIVQIDYEFPVGPWAAKSVHIGQARVWPMRHWLHWSANNEACTLYAQDQSSAQTYHDALLALNPSPCPVIQLDDALEAHWDFQHYQNSIQKIHDYIKQGDVYQVNLTMPFFAQCAAHKKNDIALFLKLQKHSPAPYSAFFRQGQRSIISHSPERFLSIQDSYCSSHPIKGTCKRIAGQESFQRDALLHSEKDSAELAMIIDLVRNDLGRVAELGSVRVTDERVIMDLPYVHHALGHIECTLKETCQHTDVLAACFPPGSITGAPKIRAMEVIEELEDSQRGAYCGCFGWLGEGADCELAVAIRSMQLDGGALRLDAGGGIIIDSKSKSEWQELNDKASGMRQVFSGQHA